ncbi:hypothetical protein [Amycolatopsis vancoresmycina]|uniref:Lipoprotein n=1 Tax=Amycolatopsis vancoresmycina DSM 44592 TaxID=1292037 RepID=R1GE14_9PSEU|nr:hypothetical protein [Amycolatopsis vancoresmycina]EOD69473.1 hypothetical protein H480_05729 [Amycolatopsis vancoresmycina DSM 44592]
MRWPIVFVVAAVLGAAGCAKAPDPRAYAGSESGVSWEEATARYRISPPACPVDGLRFDVQPPLTDRLAFTFTAEKSCVDGYLRQYGVDPAAPPLSWPKDADTVREPFDPQTMQELGWTFDPHVEQVYYAGFRTPDRWSSFEVLVRPGPGRETAYFLSKTLGGEG